MMPEQRGREGSQPTAAPRFRFGLEAPLVGRFVGENKKLIFGPPVWYDILCAGCAGGGLVATLWLLFTAPSYQGVFTLAVMIGGMWAIASSERFVVDLRTGATLRFEGGGPLGRRQRGHISEIDALVLLTEIYPISAVGQAVIYRLVLYWKGHAQPLLVAQSLRSHVNANGPINAGAGGIAQMGVRYAAALKLPFYDNSAFPSPPPLKPF